MFVKSFLVRIRSITVLTIVDLALALLLGLFGGLMLSMPSSVIFELFGIFKFLLAFVAIKVSLFRMDFSMCVDQTRKDGSFEITFITAIELHILLMSSPQMSVKNIPIGGLSGLTLRTYHRVW